MIQAYIDAAMEHAHYEMFDDETIYGELPDCPGVYANEATLEQCRRILEEVLEGWILIRLQEHLELPVIAGISLQAPVHA